MTPDESIKANRKAAASATVRCLAEASELVVRMGASKEAFMALAEREYEVSLARVELDRMV